MARIMTLLFIIEIIDMKKIVFTSLLICTLLLSKTHAQTNDKFLLTNVYHYAGLSTVHILDPYLSSLDYSGIGLRYEEFRSRLFNPDNQKISSFSRLSGMLGLTINPAATASVSYMGIDYGWGVHYRYPVMEDVLLLAGGFADVNFGYKSNSRNVNNPVNIDLSTDLNASLGARFYIHTRRRVIQVNAMIDFPVIGCMFVPYPGLSYYEMYLSRQYSEAIHFSSLHNRQGIRQLISVDFPLKNSTISIGIRSGQLKYQASEQVYNFDEYSLVFGFTYDKVSFSGRKKNIPDTFISPK